MYRTRMFLSRTGGCGMDLEVFLSPGSRPSAVCGLEVPFAKTRFAGAKGICPRGAFDPCSPDTPKGDAGRRSLKPIQQAITSTAATPTAVSHRPLYHGTHFARFNTAQAECVSAGNVPARAMKVPKAWYIARFVAAAATDTRSLRASSLWGLVSRILCRMVDRSAANAFFCSGRAA